MYPTVRANTDEFGDGDVLAAVGDRFGFHQPFGGRSCRCYTGSNAGLVGRGSSLPTVAGALMRGIKSLLAVALMVSVAGASAQEHGRIKRPPPTPTEADRIASETAMNDSSLQKGDIVVTDRGFFVFRGVGADGYTYDFGEVPNPLLLAKK